MSTWEAVVTILGLAAITVLTRAFFMIPRDDLPLPGWLREGLDYAPLAALIAVVAPEVLMQHGALITDWRDARLFGALAGLAWFWWRRGILGTIVCGTATMMVLRLLAGW